MRSVDGRRWGRALAWTAAGLAGIGAASLFTGARWMNARINRPEFRAALEAQASEKMGATLTFDTFQSHVGLRPWVLVENIDFKGADGDFRMTADQARIAVRVLPLLRKRVVFSTVVLRDPRIRVRRPADGSPPTFPLLAEKSGEEREGFVFLVNEVSVRGAELRLVDESRPGHPSVTLRADADLARQRRGGGLTLDLSGTVDGAQGRGRYRVYGQVGRETKLSVKGTRLPLGLLGEFLPAAAPWAGAVAVEGEISGGAGRWRWSLDGSATALRRTETDHTLPLELEWALRSESTSTVQAVWESSGTRVRATAAFAAGGSPRVEVAVAGERLDLGDVMDVVRQIPAASAGTSASTASWSLGARVDLDQFVAGRVQAQRVRGAGEWAGGVARLTRLNLDLFGGTVTIRGRGQRASGPNAPWKIGGLVELKDVQAADVAQALGSTLPWVGAVSGRADVNDLPIPEGGGSAWAEAAWGVFQAGKIQASLSGANLGFGSWVLEESGFDLGRGSHSTGGTVRLFGRRASSSFAVEAAFPRLARAEGAKASPATLRMEILNIDLEALGLLAPGLGFRSGWATLAGDWRSDFRRKPVRDFLFDGSSLWGFDLRLSSADWKGVPLPAFAGRLAWGGDGALRAENVGGTVSGGVLEGEGTVDGLKEGGALSFSLNTKLKNVETAELMAALSTSAYLVKGRFEGALSVDGPLLPWDPGRLNGRFFLKGQQGAFRAAPAVLKIFSALKLQTMLKRLEGEKTEGLPFDILEASAPIRDGRYLLDQPLVLKNPAFQLAYTGWMDVRFENGRGTLLFNFLQGTSDLIKAIPGLSSLVLGSGGELFPLVVDVAVEGGKTEVTPRSIQTLTGPLVSVVKNVFRLPFRLFPKKKADPGP